VPRLLSPGRLAAISPNRLDVFFMRMQVQQKHIRFLRCQAGKSPHVDVTASNQHHGGFLPSVFATVWFVKKREAALTATPRLWNDECPADRQCSRKPPFPTAWR
jgi:hypothetical protein